MAKYKYTVKFKVETDYRYTSKNLSDAETLEISLKDLIQVAVLPTLDLELIPLTFEVKKGRN
jgi:hypothetical protein